MAKLVHSCSKSLAVSHPGKTKSFCIEVFIPIEGTLPPKSGMVFPLSVGACSRRSAVCIMSPVGGELCTCSHAGGHAHLLPPCLPRFYTRKACICQLSRGNLHSLFKVTEEVMHKSLCHAFFLNRLYSCLCVALLLIRNTSPSHTSRSCPTTSGPLTTQGTGGCGHIALQGT